jgi:post-segregation antitoxin (ccd killing protein)
MLELTVKVPERLAEEARARGVSVEVYVQEILAQQASKAAGAEQLGSIRAAAQRIVELRKGNKLSGLRTKDLVHEGHKY